MLSGISPFFMFKLIIKTQKYYKNKNSGYQRGQISLYKVRGFCHLSIKIQILRSVIILEVAYVGLEYFIFNSLTKVKNNLHRR